MNKSALMKLDFDRLYKQYDESTNEQEKQYITQIVNEKPLVTTNPYFHPYPGSYTKDFQKQIYQKQEFNANQLFLDTMGISDDCNSDFSIKPHQSFLKNYITVLESFPVAGVYIWSVER